MRIALVSFLLLSVCLAPQRAGAELLPQFSSPERLMQWTFTYRDAPRPERLPEAVRAMYELGLLRDEEKTGYFIGFIAGVLHDNPKSAGTLIARMVPLPAKEQAVLIRAIGYSRLPEWPALMIRYAPLMAERELLIDEFLAGVQPDLLHAPWSEGPTVIYTLWGFYVATGDPAPARRVIAALEHADPESADPFSMERISAAIGLDDEEDRISRLDRLIVGSTAKWTLVSYAEHDRELLDLYRAEIPRQPENIAAPLAEVLAAAERFEAERVRRDETAVVDEMRRRLALAGPATSRAAYAGSVGLATACVVAGAVGHPEIAIPCVVTGALYSGTMKLLER